MGDVFHYPEEQKVGIYPIRNCDQFVTSENYLQFVGAMSSTLNYDLDFDMK